MPVGRRPVVITSYWQPHTVEPPPDDSMVGTPPRRPQSVRRTSHIDMTWSEGARGPAHFHGRARDLRSGPDLNPEVIDEVEIIMNVDAARVIETFEVTPGRDGVDALIGTNSGRGLRAAVGRTWPDERAAGSPLTFLLDDIPVVGSSIGSTAWAQRPPDAVDEEVLTQTLEHTRNFAYNGRTLCSGLRPGGYHEASLDRRISFPHYFRAAGDLTSQDDSWAWHPIEEPSDVCARRRRRIDCWPDGELIRIEAHYRDSSWGPEQDEVAIHEYTLQGAFEIGSHVLRSLSATALVLPFPECPSAAAKVGALVGLPADSLRTQVHEALSGTDCCTHLNDMLRGLSDVPALVAALL